jgi:hypothetical protein
MAGGRPPLALVPGRVTQPGRDAGDPGPSTDRSEAGRRAGLELTALGTGLVLAMVLMARLASWAHQLGTFQSLYVVAFTFFALAVALARRVTVARAGLLVFTVAAAARLALLPVTPTLSDDIYRYLWEGSVAARGLDPYRHSPADPGLAALRDSVIHPRINHPELATIYPPLSIAGFALVSKLSPTVPAMKSWVILHDLALILVLLAWARARGANGAWVIAYAWNPLVLVEYSGSGHHDPVALVWLVAALMWAERHPTRAALALSVGVLTKLAPVVALPFLWRRWPWRARLWVLAVVGAGLTWFWSETRGGSSGLTAYLGTWANNELAFHYLSRLVPDPWLARWVAAALLILLAIAVAWRHAWEAPRATRFVARAGFLLSPVAHPWYLGWVLALEPLAPSAPWLLLSLTAILSYGVFASPREGGAFHLSLIGRWFEYGVPLALAATLALRRRVTTSRPGAAT